MCGHTHKHTPTHRVAHTLYSQRFKATKNRGYWSFLITKHKTHFQNYRVSPPREAWESWFGSHWSIIWGMHYYPQCFDSLGSVTVLNLALVKLYTLRASSGNWASWEETMMKQQSCNEGEDKSNGVSDMNTWQSLPPLLLLQNKHWISAYHLFLSFKNNGIYGHKKLTEGIGDDLETLNFSLLALDVVCSSSPQPPQHCSQNSPQHHWTPISASSGIWRSQPKSPSRTIIN